MHLTFLLSYFVASPKVGNKRYLIPSHAECQNSNALPSKKALRQLPPLPENASPGLGTREKKRIRKKILFDGVREDKQKRLQAAQAADIERRMALLESLDTDARKEYEARLEEIRQERQARKESRRLAIMERMAHRPRLAVDLSFVTLFSSREQQSLCRQVQRMYGQNIASPTPFALTLTSFHGDIAEQFLEYPGFSQWVIDCEKRPVESVFPVEKIIFLTPDSENDLDELDPEAIYCIGGIVDRNQLKNLSLSKATGLSMATARLPLHRMSRRLASPVLSLNMCFSALLQYSGCRDWDVALDTVFSPCRDQVTRSAT